MFQEVEDQSYQGIRFCNKCRNILIPYKAIENILEFQCKNCGKQEVDFKDKTDDECLLYSKQMSNNQQEGDAIDKDFALDPTMPRVKVTCQNCMYHQAVYCLQPEQGQRKIKVLLVCARIEKNKVICGQTWQLQEDVFIKL